MTVEKEFQELKEYVDAPKTKVVNIPRHSQMIDAYEKIKKIILSEDPDAIIEIIEGALQLGSMAIRAVTSDVTVYDTAEFSEAIKDADNFQIYALTDGRITLDILFEGVLEYILI